MDKYIIVTTLCDKEKLAVKLLKLILNIGGIIN